MSFLPLRPRSALSVADVVLTVGVFFWWLVLPLLVGILVLRRLLRRPRAPVVP